MTFNREQDILGLDYDGVISDSIRECFVVAHNAYAGFSGGQQVTDFDELDLSLAGESRRLRNYIRSGEDYVYIYHAIKIGAVINNQQDFDDFINEHAGLYTTFFELFYNVRSQLSREQPDLWIRLNPLYPGMKEFLTGYEPRQNLYIVTTKKIAFVDKILTFNQISLQADKKIAADKKRTKKIIINELLTQNNWDPKCFYFIDDQVDTLLNVQDLGIQVCLAAWGYNNAGQQQRARDAGIDVLGLDGFFIRFGV